MRKSTKNIIDTITINNRNAQNNARIWKLLLTLQQLLFYSNSEKMKKALLAVLVYFLITQLLAGAAAIAIAMILKTDPKGGIPENIMALCMSVTIVIAIIVCWKGLKVMRIPETFCTTDIKWGWALVAIVACAFGAFAGNLLTEMANLPNMIEDLELDLARNIWGILAIAILGPIAEELLFREGVCGYLARNGMNPWKAIWISAILFGIVHVNPAQVPFAMLLGLMLGIIYIKTGNIVVCSIVHMLNNSFAVVQVWLLGDKIKDFSLVEGVGGEVVAGLCIIVSAALCFYLLRRFWETTPRGTSDGGQGYRGGLH